MSRPALSVVVLSYARPAYLHQALASIVAQPLADREILVVDNRSPASEEVAAAVAAFPEARLHRLGRNLGFTGGMNAGIALASGRCVLLSEDDIVLEPGCLAALLAESERAGEGTILAPVMVDAGTRRVRAAGGDLSLGPPYRLRIRSENEDLASVPGAPYDVTFASGACLLFPRPALDALGGFRDDYFMYFEDTELCLRARRRRIRVAVVPAARVAHLPPARLPPGPSLATHKLKNLLATYVLHAPLRVLPEVAVRYGLLEGARGLARGPRELATVSRAWLWLAWHGRALLRDRARERRASR